MSYEREKIFPGKVCLAFYWLSCRFASKFVAKKKKEKIFKKLLTDGEKHDIMCEQMK